MARGSAHRGPDVTSGEAPCRTRRRLGPAGNAEGFTLVELMVTMLVFGIVIAMTYAVVTTMGTVTAGAARDAAATDQMMTSIDELSSLVRTATACPSGGADAGTVLVSAYDDSMSFCAYPPGSASIGVVDLVTISVPSCSYPSSSGGIYAICHMVATSVPAPGSTAIGSTPGWTLDHVYVYDPFGTMPWPCAPLSPAGCSAPANPLSSSVFSYYGPGGAQANNALCVTAASSGCSQATLTGYGPCAIQTVQIRLTVIGNTDLSLPVTRQTGRTSSVADVFLPDVANPLSC